MGDSSLQPGGAAIQMSSDNWSKRLGEICRKIVFEKLGEEEVYGRFYKSWLSRSGEGQDFNSEGFTENVCTSELRECRVGPIEPPPTTKKKAENADVKPKAGQKRK